MAELASLSAVVPVFNSAGSMPALVERLEPVLAAAARDYELLLVDDASNDGSWERILELAARHPWVRGVRLMRNSGQHNALLCGIRAARGEVIATLDDDLQNPPEELPRMLAKLADEQLDVVYGTPERERHGLLRDLASQVTKLALSSAMGAGVARHVSAFRVFRTELRSAFTDYKSPFVSIDVLLTWGTTRFGAVTVRHEARAEGRSGYTLGKLVTHAFNMLTGFSTFPLQIASLVGFACTLLGVGLLLYVLARAVFEGGAPPGFPFLASMVALFSGAQLFALGILGEYLARMHSRTMDRPAYTVKTRAEQPGDEDR